MRRLSPFRHLRPRVSRGPSAPFLEKEAGADSVEVTGQNALNLRDLSSEQLNRKLAKRLGWKEVNGKWWHDDIGDGPPSDYCKMLSRGFVITVLEAPDKPKGALP